MGHYVIKTDRDQDLYVIWSSTVDAPIWIGDRKGLSEYLWHEYRREHPESDPFPGTGPDVRMERADMFGTSDVHGAYGWDDEAFNLMFGAPDDEYFHELPRANLAAYCQAIGRGQDDEARAMLRRTERVDELDEPH
jgi:hypothetical protein